MGCPGGCGKVTLKGTPRMSNTQSKSTRATGRIIGQSSASPYGTPKVRISFSSRSR